MDAGSRTEPLVVVVGETASGKTALALELAKRFNGEIICADSRTIYKDLDIGTAKPSLEERIAIRHHLLDVVSPDKSFSAADFKRYATQAIADILNRGKLPIMVGGTGLYIDAVLFDFQFRPPADFAARQELSGLTVAELQRRLVAANIPLPRNTQNPRHLVRSLETGGRLGTRSVLRANTLILGLRLDREILQTRIQKRVETMIEAGFVEEVRRLSKLYGWDAPGLQAPGYKAFRSFVEGTATLDEAKALFIRNDIKLAKRQRTWFRRNNSIQWLTDSNDAVDIVTTFLNKTPI